ncbi:MAG: LPXTG cell wall anchor domain-containing protein [Methanoregula sp.]|uniref:LPXTG cell wall anchor domain-containing protein n=3 Tax=Methanoregula sp. TaxID=2052170 RepID=UPI003C60B7AF
MVLLFLLTAVGFLVLPASADTTTYLIQAANNVYVSNYTIDPAVLFTGDTATATFYVTNGNANQSVMVNHATFGDNDILLTSGSYDTNVNIGPLQTQAFVFSVGTDKSVGTYYPSFSLSFSAGNGLYYRTPVKVDNTPLVMTIADQPDAFAQGVKETICVQISNPRDNDVKNVILEATGNDVTLTPSKTYIGYLAAGTSTMVNFTSTADDPTTLFLNVNYDNGDNSHTINATLPIVFTTDKLQADPVMSNIVIALNNGTYDVTGDVTNAGLSNANGVTVTSLSPAVPQDPERNYVIGTLKPDDFGSFEITFTAPDGTTSVPLQQSYKDNDGNVITSVQNIDLTQATTQTGSKPSMLPALVVVIIIVLGVGGYLYQKKRKNQ